MKFLSIARAALFAALSFNAVIINAAQTDTKGYITIENVDCPWFRGSYFAAQMNIDHSNGCYGYATGPVVLNEGETKSWILPFGTVGACTYRISGSIDHLPVLKRNQKVVFKMDSHGLCTGNIEG